MRFFERRLFISSTACSLSVAMRIIAAVVGGYALAHSLPIAIAAVMPITKAALFAIQGSFLVYTAAVIWVFAARNARAAWLGLLVPTALTGLVAWGFL
jgi:hypothetical protein